MRNLYPIYHEVREILLQNSLPLDRYAHSVHFWDPMKNQATMTAAFAPSGAAASRVPSMMTMITTITTTFKRGRSG